MSEISIPNRFESLNEAFQGQVRPLILPIQEDLQTFIRLAEKVKVQNGGLISFLLAKSGIGKTTAVYSASINLPELFAPVFSVPPEVKFRDVAPWLTSKLPGQLGEKRLLVLFDGREVSDDDVGLKQFLAALNQILRRRPDVIFCWPTTDDAWLQHVREIAKTIGGTNFVPDEGNVAIQGPPAGEWPSVLDRLLLQFQKTLEDIGIGRDLVGQLCSGSESVGDFLNNVATIISERITSTRKAKRLPRLVFVVTSSGDASGEANRIRRAGNQILSPEPLLGHSPRSEAGKWWTARNVQPNHHLGYMISLFEARLVTMSASSIAYSCALYGDADLQQAVTALGIRPDKGNAGRAVKVTDLCRLLTGDSIPEFTSSKKGQTSDTTIQAYEAVQALSAKRHKAINSAICKLVSEYATEYKFDLMKFEQKSGDDLVTDSVIQKPGSELHLEFHHLSAPSCKAASMSAYIMDKIRIYSIYHQLIPR